MAIKITYYLEVISSWCFWAEPAWAELKARYPDATFEWKLALMDQTGLPTSKSQCEWFYQRSGTIVRSPFMLNSGWYDPQLKEYLAPNLIAEAGRDFSINDDRIRLAIAKAALRDGRKVGNWNEAAAIGAAAANLVPERLLERAKSPEVEARARKTTAEFHALQVSQRPTFVIENEIGDKAVYSGVWKIEPLVAIIESMRADAAAYASHAAHFGKPPLA
jgi:predicted DsbA family dithiol-disulfide isomerase